MWVLIKYRLVYGHISKKRQIWSFGAYYRQTLIKGNTYSDVIVNSEYISMVWIGGATFEGRHLFEAQRLLEEMG